MAKEEPNKTEGLQSTAPKSELDKFKRNPEQQTENAGTSEVSPSHEKAMEKGWRPQEEWSGEADQWVDAGEFLRRGELMDRISDQTRQIRKYDDKVNALENTVKVVSEQQKKIAEIEYKRAYDKLKNEKLEALDYGEHRKAAEIDDKIEELKEARKDLDSDTISTEPNTQQAPQADPAIVNEWLGRNSWYQEDVAMQGAADAIVARYIGENPGIEADSTHVLNYVESQIKKTFPDKFQAKRRPAGGPTDGGQAGRTQSKSKYTIKNVPDHLKDIVKSMTEDGSMSVHDYVEQLVEMGAMEG